MSIVEAGLVTPPVQLITASVKLRDADNLSSLLERLIEGDEKGVKNRKRYGKMGGREGRDFDEVESRTGIRSATKILRTPRNSENKRSSVVRANWNTADSNGKRTSCYDETNSKEKKWKKNSRIRVKRRVTYIKRTSSEEKSRPHCARISFDVPFHERTGPMSDQMLTNKRSVRVHCGLRVRQVCCSFARYVRSLTLCGLKITGTRDSEDSEVPTATNRTTK